jgi:uncharacterized membrane protein YozB (DUF420 family)
LVDLLALEFLLNVIALHAGTPVVVSQTTLTLMFVVLGIVLIGIGFGRFSKSKESLLQHRWSMTVALILTVASVSLVMLPSAFTFYTDTDLEFFSPLSILTLIHGVVGVPAITLALIYAFGDLPQKIKRWMRWAALFWIASLILGVIVFLEMLGLVSMSM